MKTRLPYLTLNIIIVYFSGVISAFGFLQRSTDNGIHLCGYGEHQAENRRYARFLAHLNVGTPRTVRLIYFLPAGRLPREGIEEKIDALIKDVRKFYADQMENHGFGRKTFSIETDHAGTARVHRVNGQFTDTYYYDNDALRRVWREIHNRFDTSQNIYLAVVDVGNEQIGDVAGIAATIGEWGGIAAIPASGPFFNHPLAAHELGHTFGLDHDFRSTHHIMSYGPWAWGRTTRLSGCTARWLEVQRYFNPGIPRREWSAPSIGQISSQRYMEGSERVSIQLNVSDHEGLHQVLLLGFQDNVSACHEFAGELSSLVEFDYDGVFTFREFASLANHAVHPIRARVVDTDGNVSDTSFYLFPDTLQSLSKISGDNQPAGLPNAPLPVPLVVELRNENDGSPYEGVRVSFTVTAGGGRLSETGALTDDYGRAATVFTLGPHPGTNTVEVSALGHTTTFNAVAGSPVNVPDSLLRSAIARTLDKVSGEPISQAEMATLTSTARMFWSLGISDLTGFEVAINLTYLDLGNNSLTDISPLTELTNLTQLALDYNLVSDISALAGLTKLTQLTLANNSIEDISPLATLTALEQLLLGNNAISDISPIAKLINLKLVYLEDNNIKDVSPLKKLVHLRVVQLAGNSVSNLSPLAESQGLEDGTQINVRKNPLSYPSIKVHIPTLQGRGVEIYFDNRTPMTLEPISGNNQEGLPGKALTRPFTIEVKDENGLVFEGVPVTFAVTSGGGTLAKRNTITDTNGRAESILTLGKNPGTNAVRVTVEDISQPEIFYAEGIRVAQELSIISGNNQEGLPGETLPNSLVVEVRDQFDTPLRSVQVTFAITAGGGTLTAAKTNTDRNGRATTKLTLGPNPGTNTISVSASGIEQSESFKAEGVRTPQKVSIISGDNQEGLPGETLEKPIVIEVRDQRNQPLRGVRVTFVVTAGGGTLTVTTTETDTNGRAQSELTLGPNAGTNTVSVSVSDIDLSKFFTAQGIRTPHAILKISGDNQEGLPGEALTDPFIVEVRDKNGFVVEGVPVTFAVTAGEGTLDQPNTATDANGRARNNLTLGDDPVTNTIRAIAEGISQPVTFNAKGIRVPKTLLRISGDDQEGFPGETLPNSLVVEVRDQFDTPLRSVQVTFAITAGGGTLTAAKTNTDRNGRATTKLTLGPNPGTNTISVSASGIEQSESFKAEGVRTPQKVSIISGDNQEGLPGETLEKPIVIEVRDQRNQPLRGVRVTFVVTAGGGTLTVTTTETDTNGRAQSELTLGPNAGTNTVSVSVSDIDLSKFFTAQGIRTPHAILKISGDNQEGLPGEALTDPFIVEVRDKNGFVVEGVPVTFAVTAGEGTLDQPNTATDANGRARNNLTLGDDPVTNTIRAIAEGISQPVTFNAKGIRVPKTLLRISGDDQEGFPGESISNPLVVEVRDQFDTPLEEVQVTFTITAGGGTLSSTDAKTDGNGRTQSELILGLNAGTNKVSASVSGIEQSVTFSSEGVRTPQLIVKISGDEQEGIPNTELPHPFVIEVQDKNGSSLEGALVTFALADGDATPSVTSATTDSNGRAESTLTLGKTPGVHSVEVSVKGVDATVIFRAVSKRREFILSLPSGSSLIHIPLQVTEIDGKAGEIESVGDLYDALGGGEAVNLLTTRDPRTNQWHSYLGDRSRGTITDSPLTDDKGVIASMKFPAELHLAGDALGKDGMGTIRLQPGSNLVGVPLKDSRITRVSDLLTLEGIRDNVASVTVSVNGNFKVVARAGDDGDVPVAGGQSFIMDAQYEAVVPVSGDGWGSYSGAQAAPSSALSGPIAQNASPVLHLTGSIVYVKEGRENKSLLMMSGLCITVKNLITGKTITTLATKEDPLQPDRVGYQLTAVEATTGRAAQAGDILEISLLSLNPLIRVEPLRHTVTPTDVKNSQIRLSPLVTYELPTETALLMNYPNPFNPETWIPYQLAEDTTVTMAIYDAKGELVRRLEIGHQSAGFYTERDRAAYWDGRNENGESVTSGLYFYQLGTPSFRQLRRMLIVK